jgi:hypothetical protein
LCRPLLRHACAASGRKKSLAGGGAKAGRNVGHCPDGGVVKAPLETDGAERRISVRYSDAKADLVVSTTFAAPGCKSPQIEPRFLM